QRPCCGPYPVLLRQLHCRHPQMLRNALTTPSFTPPVFKLQLRFFDFRRNRIGRSLTHQHALLFKTGTLTLSIFATRIHAPLPKGHRYGLPRRALEWDTPRLSSKGRKEFTGSSIAEGGRNVALVEAADGVRINGEQHYLWRAVDQNGDVIDIRVQPRRDQRAAGRFFRRLLRGASRMSSGSRLVSSGLSERVVDSYPRT